MRNLLSRLAAGIALVALFLSGSGPPPSIGRADTSPLRKSQTDEIRFRKTNIRTARVLTPSIARQEPKLRLDATLIQVPTVVSDASGRYIPDLTRSDFTISENGKKQEIALFQSVAQPFTAVLLLDTSNSAADRLGAIKKTAINFLDQLREGDRAAVVSFDNEIRELTEFTGDRNELEGAIRQAESGFGKLLYEAMSRALEKLRSVEGRRAVILFSDCVDMKSVDATVESASRLAEEISAAVYILKFETRWWVEAEARKRQAERKESNHPFSVDARIPLPPDRGGSQDKKGPRIEVSTQGIPTVTLSGNQDDITKVLDDLYGKADAFAKSIADRTGGVVYTAHTIDDIQSAFGAIADELRNQYLLGYYASDSAGKGKYRAIKVQVARKGARVRARAGYRISTSDDK